ncbi:hypothetical protein FA13DRAFT_1722963, partial [Coprinellus micaceus]
MELTVSTLVGYTPAAFVVYSLYDGMYLAFCSGEWNPFSVACTYQDNSAKTVGAISYEGNNLENAEQSQDSLVNQPQKYYNYNTPSKESQLLIPLTHSTAPKLHLLAKKGCPNPGAMNGTSLTALCILLVSSRLRGLRTATAWDLFPSIRGPRISADRNTAAVITDKANPSSIYPPPPAKCRCIPSSLRFLFPQELSSLDRIARLRPYQPRRSATSPLRYSPSGRTRAVLREVKEWSGSGSKYFVELWAGDRLKYEVDVTEKHGAFYADGHWKELISAKSTLEHSPSTRTKLPSCIPLKHSLRKDDNDPYAKWRFRADLGEGLSGKKRPAAFIIRWDESNATVSRILTPDHLYLGQYIFSPFSTNTLFASAYEPQSDGRLLGVKGCFNRPRGIWQVDLDSTQQFPEKWKATLKKLTEGMVSLDSKAYVAVQSTYGSRTLVFWSPWTEGTVFCTSMTSSAGTYLLRMATHGCCRCFGFNQDSGHQDSRKRPTETVVVQSTLNEKVAPCILVPHGGPMRQQPQRSAQDHRMVLEGLWKVGCGRLYGVLGTYNQLGIAEDGPGKLFVQGGSHGGFLTAHLIGQFPDKFTAASMRNPVISGGDTTGTDIPDWYYLEF